MARRHLDYGPFQVNINTVGFYRPSNFSSHWLVKKKNGGFFVQRLLFIVLQACWCLIFAHCVINPLPQVTDPCVDSILSG